MENKKRKKWKLVVKVACLFVGVCLFFFFLILGPLSGGLLSPLPYRSLASFEGKVIDTDTKEPIEGAVVLGVYYYETYSIAGSNSHLKDGQETQTDKKGEFKLPRTRRWFVLNRGYPRGRLVIFKPGYGVFPDHARSSAGGESKTWPPPGRYIVYSLPKLNTIWERRSNIPGSFSEIPYENNKLYMNAINEERKSVGLSPYPVPTKEK